MIGLVGGIGAGKSSVARQASRVRRLLIIDADEVGHAALQEPSIVEQLVGVFGESVKAPDGAIDRRVLASLVFGESRSSGENRSELERIVHPWMRAQVEQKIQQIKASDAHVAGILLDAAILFETGWSVLCQAVVFVESPDDARFERVHESRGWSLEQWRAREATQLGLEEKREQSDFVISNGRGELESAGMELANFVDRLNLEQSPVIT